VPPLLLLELQHPQPLQRLPHRHLPHPSKICPQNLESKNAA
jgi:hypothetical protein